MRKLHYAQPAVACLAIIEAPFFEKRTTTVVQEVTCKRCITALAAQVAEVLSAPTPPRRPPLIIKGRPKWNRKWTSRS